MPKSKLTVFDRMRKLIKSLDKWDLYKLELCVRDGLIEKMIANEEKVRDCPDYKMVLLARKEMDAFIEEHCLNIKEMAEKNKVLAIECAPNVSIYWGTLDELRA